MDVSEMGKELERLVEAVFSPDLPALSVNDLREAQDDIQALSQAILALEAVRRMEGSHVPKEPSPREG